MQTGGQHAAERESQTQTFLELVEFGEAVENAYGVFLGDAASGIFDGEKQLAVVRPRLQRDAAFFGELDGVVEKGVQYAAQHVLVGCHREVGR